MKKRLPTFLLHDWCRQPGQSRHSRVYVCTFCRNWTANLPLYRYEICPTKDRRIGPDRRKA